jgi:hypothetical protein
MRLVMLPLLLAGCAAGSVDARRSFAARNVGQTVVTHVEGPGTQALYLAPDGALFLWAAARPEVRRGRWRLEPVVPEATASYQATAGMNRPAEELAEDWRVCFRYRDGEAETRPEGQGGDWSCLPVAAFDGLVVERAPGDVLGLSTGVPPGAMPAGRRLGLAALRDL